MPSIRLLAPEVYSRIAAGEVVERPASSLKELLENSLDAGASRVTIEVKGAGRDCLRITDDGRGMDREDCEACLGRHATSKIGAFEDLQSLSTFGFRGEALFAIAAVSRLTITTSVRGAKSGWKIAAEGGKVVSSGPAPAVPGTTVEVKDLFYNTPARLKFLKSGAFEKGRLVSVVEEAALANPGLRLSYKSEGRQVLLFEPEPAPDSPEAARRRAAQVLGSENARGLLEVNAERPGFKLLMFVSGADGMVPTRGFQSWFVNRRPVSARILQQALYKGSEAHRSPGRHPACVAHLTLAPDSFDVNVHPGKREIRLRSDRDVFELVSGLVASALAKSKTAAPLTLEPRQAGAVREPVAAYYLGGRSFFPEEPAFALKTEPAGAFAPPSGSPRWFTPPYRFLGQIEKTYLLFEAAGGLFILDQHAAAERILFERFLAEIGKGGAKSQRLILPLAVELPASAILKVLSRKERLSRLGFEVEPFGKTALNVTAAPALFHKSKDLKEMVLRLLESLEDPVGAAEAASHDAVATIACKAAVKAHDALGEKEALRLLEDLKDCQDGSSCPHGRRAMLALNRDELARRFQRPGAPPL